MEKYTLQNVKVVRVENQYGSLLLYEVYMGDDEGEKIYELGKEKNLKQYMIDRKENLNLESRILYFTTCLQVTSWSSKTQHDNSLGESSQLSLVSSSPKSSPPTYELSDTEIMVPFSDTSPDEPP